MHARRHRFPRHELPPKPTTSEKKATTGLGVIGEKATKGSTLGYYNAAATSGVLRMFIRVLVCVVEVSAVWPVI